jgi:murein L,D-transpeptidase YcbB/YkuD
VKNKHEVRTGHRPVRRLFIIAGAVAVLAAAPVSFPAFAEAATFAVPQGQSVDDFYEIRQDRPLWFQAGQPTAAAQALIGLLSTAAVDGLDPSNYKVDDIRKALRKASDGDSKAVKKADALLSREFTAYARDLRNPPATGLQYLDPALNTGPPTPLWLLQVAARAPSLTQFIADMGWMNPDYAPLRRALLNGQYSGDKQREILGINLQRARVLPASNRYIIVNTATQRLYMYDDNKLADSMKVVVGQERPDRKTPMVAGYLHYASLNPYWNVPPDLVWDDVGIYVQKFGLGYLKSRGYQILSDWTDDATVVDPTTIDWNAVKDGKVELRVRQLPGPENFLGDVKYTFTNPYGVYLHDTPRKELLTKDIRLFSGGCIRLEDAARLGRWLFGHTLTTTSTDPEIKVPLDKPVPVYVTYLTAVPDGSSITYMDDVYGWDAQRLAELGHGTSSVANVSNKVAASN